MNKLLFLAALAGSCAPQAAADKEVTAWERQAQNVTIVRDTWGIPHVYGKTDADAVFGAMFAFSSIRSTLGLFTMASRLAACAALSRFASTPK